LQSELLGAQAAGIRNVLCSSAGEVEMVRRLNHGVDLGGNALGSRTSLAVGMMGRASGAADFLVTPPMHDAAALEEILRGCEVAVIVGIRPLQSVREAEYTMHELGLAVPAETIARLSVGGAAEGLAIAREMLERVRGLAAGVLWIGIETTELH